MVCLTGKVENELHFLLDCYVYNRLRQNLYQRVKQSTGYDLDVVRRTGTGCWRLCLALGYLRKSLAIRSASWLRHLCSSDETESAHSSTVRSRVMTRVEQQRLGLSSS